jgi:putative flippase GtrA
VRAHRARLARFALTGGAAGLLQLGLLALFVRLGWPALVSDAAAFALATQANFALSQGFTWADRPADVGGLRARWLRYHAAVGGSALLNMAVFAAADRVLPSLAAAAAGIAAAASFNYLSGDRLVFRSAGSAALRTVPTAVPGRPPRRVGPARRAA